MQRSLGSCAPGESLFPSCSVSVAATRVFDACRSDSISCPDSESCTCWMSSSGSCDRSCYSNACRRTCQPCGSDGSRSEISSEILCLTSDANESNDSEDTASTRYTAFTHTRCPSPSSIPAADYVSPSEVVSESLSRLSSEPHLQQKQLVSSDNPYLQNYDVPRSSCLSQCASTCISMNTLCSRSMTQASERTFSPEILAYQMSKHLDVSDEPNIRSSSESNFGSFLRSSCSTCSSNGSGPSSVFSSLIADYVASGASCPCGCSTSDASQH